LPKHLSPPQILARSITVGAGHFPPGCGIITACGSFSYSPRLNWPEWGLARSAIMLGPLDGLQPPRADTRRRDRPDQADVPMPSDPGGLSRRDHRNTIIGDLLKCRQGS
jgi:hypothetical protein